MFNSNAFALDKKKYQVEKHDFPYGGCNLFLPHLILVIYCVPLFVTATLFADDTQVIFIYNS